MKNFVIKRNPYENFVIKGISCQKLCHQSGRTRETKHTDQAEPKNGQKLRVIIDHP